VFLFTIGSRICWYVRLAVECGVCGDRACLLAVRVILLHPVSTVLRAEIEFLASISSWTRRRRRRVWINGREKPVREHWARWITVSHQLQAESFVIPSSRATVRRRMPSLNGWIHRRLTDKMGIEPIETQCSSEWRTIDRERPENVARRQSHGLFTREIFTSKFYFKSLFRIKISSVNSPLLM